MPLRTKVGRSLSDASAKKSKRPSIFNFFTKRNEYNLDVEERKKKEASHSNNNNNNHTNIDNNKTKKPVVRSKSDVGSVVRHDFRKSPRRKSNESDDVGGLKMNPQLSPIIEDQNRDDYFEENIARKTEKKPIFKTVSADSYYKKLPDKNLVDELLESPELNNITSINTLSRSSDNMHSSQLPPEKLPLTKGIKVPSMVKRLSMEKLSPPPTSDAFTYLPTPKKFPTEESKKIIYAELDHDYKPHRENLPRPYEFNNSKPENSRDTVDFVHPIKNINQRSFLYDDDDFDTTKQTPAERFASKYKSSLNYDLEHKFRSYENNDDEIIQPKLRDLPPEKPFVWNLGRREQGDGREYLPEFNDLSNRREELYSRIKSRINRDGPHVVAREPTPFNSSYQTLQKDYKYTEGEQDVLRPQNFVRTLPVQRKIIDEPRKSNIDHRVREDSPFRMPLTEDKSSRQLYENVSTSNRKSTSRTSYLSPIREPSQEMSIEYGADTNKRTVAIQKDDDGVKKQKDNKKSKRNKKDEKENLG